MAMASIQGVELVFLLLLLFVVAFGALAKKLEVPYPIVLVIAGALLAFLPGVPQAELDPEVIFLVILPPLLYASSWQTSWREFHFNFASIVSLAIGLVAFTAVGVAYLAPWLIPGFDWKTGLVLGAIVAPTDALAATSLAKQIGLPKRIVDIVEGESLVNDATGLLALEFALAIVARNATPTFGEGVSRLLYLIVAGIAVGLGVAWIVDKIERLIDDSPIEIALSILVPYAAYLTADAIKASGVLAVVACGLYLSRRSSTFFSPGVRLRTWAVWEALTFAMNGLVFILIGLQLPGVLAGIHGVSLGRLAVYGLTFSALVIVLRMMWVYPGAFVANWFRCRVLHQHVQMPSRGAVFVVGWSGMRGVIALAAAIGLPALLPSGAAFPQRQFIVFLAFCVILVTLVGQGLSLPWLVRVLGVAAEKPAMDPEEKEARSEVLRAALEYLEKARDSCDQDYDAIIEDLQGHYQHRLTAVSGANDGNANPDRRHHEQHSRVLRDLLRVERETAVRLRDEGRINDETLRQLEYELDLREAGPLEGH